MDEPEKSRSEAVIGTDQKKAPQRHNENCLNCSTPLTDVFCSHCGQKDLPRRQTLRELFDNFISSFWSYEGKFFRSTRYMITKPGFLAKEYNAGRRESYYHPARMYVFISFVFFSLLFNITGDDPEDSRQLNRADSEQLKKDFGTPPVDSRLNRLPRNSDDEDQYVLSQKTPDSLDLAGPRKSNSGVYLRLQDVQYKTIAQYDSAQQALPEAERAGWFERKIQARKIELSQRYQGKNRNFGRDLGQSLLDNISKLIFFLLPVFALLLKLLYRRKGFFYAEHLVFSIYYYNFAYLAGSLQLLFSMIPGLAWLATLLGFWIVCYLLFAMKRVYEQSWLKTIGKFLALNALFLITMLTTFVISVFWVIVLFM
jgi:hypothetical protein